MYCFKCGSPVREGEKFCAKCGAPQKTAEAPAQPEYGYTPPAQPYAQPGYAPTRQEQPAYTQPQQYNAQPGPQYTPTPMGTQNTYGYAPTEPIYTPPAQTYQRPDSPYPGYSEFAPAEPVKKKGVSKLIKFGVPIVAVVAVAVVAVILIFVSSSPMAIANKAITGMAEEATSRIDNTPLKAIGMMGDTLKDGRITVDFSYYDYWNEQEVSGSVKLSSNTEAKDYALGADLSIFGRPYDAEAYLNSERIAVGTRMLDNKYYGLKYSTFRDEIRSFGDLVGIDDQTMDEMSDAVDMIDKLMNGEKTSADDYVAYTNLVTEFVKGIEMTSESAVIESGGTSVKCKKIGFVLTDEQIVKLFNDLYDLIESDDNLREQLESIFDNPAMSGVYNNMSYRDLLKGLRDFIREFERNFSGDITYSFFVGSRDRLLRWEMDANVKYDGEKMQVSAVFDFGASAQDRWTLTMTSTVSGKSETIKVVWDYKDRSDSIENTLVLTNPEDETITLKSVWSPGNGKYKLSYEYLYQDWYGDSREETGEITGIFTTDGANFRLGIDNPIPEDDDAALTIDIKGETGAQIKQIDYISIGLWDMDLLERLQNLFYELL